MRSKIATVVALTVAAAAMIVASVVPTLAASADRPIVEDDRCAPAEEWTEIIEHPAVTHEETTTVVDEEAWTEIIPATPDLWWNFSPNDSQGTFEGPPSFPTDDRGTWQGPHENGGPAQGTYGTFPVGNPHKGGNWFHREQGTPEQTIEHPEISHEETIVVVDVEAWTEEIHHPEIVCDPNDPQGPLTPGGPDPETPDEPVVDPPAVIPPTSKGPDRVELTNGPRECIDGDEVRVEHYADGALDHVSFAPARRGECVPERTVDGVPERYAPEEGM